MASVETTETISGRIVKSEDRFFFSEAGKLKGSEEWSMNFVRKKLSKEEIKFVLVEKFGKFFFLSSTQIIFRTPKKTKKVCYTLTF
jgi:hypothetical protein